MRKRKYIYPRSISMQFHTQHMLATSLKVDPDIDVDESDKSSHREWSNQMFDGEDYGYKDD